jgi:hypothetical protein
MEMTSLRITDIPADFFETATRDIFNYSIGLVSVTKEDKEENAKIIGSGTLVDINGVSGILTAEHVIDAFPSDGEIGFVISEKLHKFSLKVQNFSFLTVAKAIIDSEGPDIGFIPIPGAVLGPMKVFKSFYNLAKRKNIIEDPPETNLGVWCVCGFPEVLTRHEGPDRGFEKVKGFMGVCGFGGVSEQYIKGEFDYYNFEVLYNANTGPPISFGGVSGGGLWQVIIAQNESNELLVKEIILSGIPFYQTEKSDDKRTVKCHGRKSIYQYSFDFIESNCS